MAVSEIFKSRSFRTHFGIDFVLVVYLGIWNSIIPLLILQKGGTRDLIAYESALALTAAVAAPILGVFAEKRARGVIMKFGCCAILAASVLSCVVLNSCYAISVLIAAEILAVLGFGAVQPLLGIYPVETAKAEQLETAFRIQKTSRLSGRIIAPMLVSVLLLLATNLHILFFAALFGLLAFVISLQIHSEQVQLDKKSQTFVSWISDLTLGFRAYAAIPAERFFILTNFGLIAAVSSLLPVVIPLMMQKHHMQGNTLAVCIGAYAVGQLVGAMGWSPLAGAMEPRRNYLLSLGIIGGALAILPMLRGILPMALCVFTIGMVWSSLSLLGFGKRNLAIPKFARVRLMATNIMLSQLASTVGFVVSGTVLEQAGQTGLQVWFFLVTGLLILYGILASSPWKFLATPNDGLDNLYAERFPA